jgi:hypothetical protein
MFRAIEDQCSEQEKTSVHSNRRCVQSKRILVLEAIADQCSGQEKANVQTIEDQCLELLKISVQSIRRTVFRAIEDQCSE